MSLRNGVLPSRTLAVWSLAAVLQLAAGSRPLQAQGSTTYYFPHLAVGASWQTTIYLYQLLPGRGDLPNRFHLRLRNSADGFVCGTGNGGQPDRRSAPRRVRHGDQSGPAALLLRQAGLGSTARGPLRVSLPFPHLSPAGGPSEAGDQCGGRSSHPLCRPLTELAEQKDVTWNALCEPSHDSGTASPDYWTNHRGKETLAWLRRTDASHTWHDDARTWTALRPLQGAVMLSAREVTSRFPSAVCGSSFELAPVKLLLDSGGSELPETPSHRKTRHSDVRIPV